MTASAPILVTGATGFIASRIVEQLLAAGYWVRGTVRSLKKPGDVNRLRALPFAAEHLELVEADLTRAGSFDAPALGCEAVMHTASPYALTVNDPQTDLVNPAVNGTRAVLGACAKTPSVRRVVLTSSMAAVTDEPDSRYTLTEADWNTKSSLSRNPYYYSKTMAERAAWTFVGEKKPQFDLIAINPFMVIGPSLTAGLNTSNQVLVDIVRGTYPGIISLTWGFVDVRDVAEAHIQAMERPAAHGRYLCAGDTFTMRDIVQLLAEKGYQGLPRMPLDSPLASAIVRLAAFAESKGVRSYLRTHVGRVPRYDTSKIRRELGIEFRPVKDTILETMEDLKRWGHLPSR